jgi:outer membrane receptor protein involved in Fe transport
VALGANQAAGGDRGHTARLALNLPLVTDTLGVALQGFDRTDPGFVRNVLTGHDHLGTTRASGGSLTARYQPTRDLSLTFRAANQAADTRGAASQDNVVGTGTPAYGERAYAATFDRGIRTRYGLRELTLEAALAQGTLTATANRALIKVLAQEDYTAAYAPLVAALTDARNVFGVPLNDPPFVPASVRADITPRVDKTSFELRFAAHRVGALEYLVGLFATREKNLYANHLVNVDAAGAPYSGAVLGFDAGSPTFTRLYERGTLVQSDLNSSYRESAVFGNVGVHFSEAVDATLGLRHAENRQSATSTSPPPGVGFINLGNYTLRSSDSATTTLATLRYRPAADLSTYARIASGYRPGGTQATPAPPPTYAPDRVVNVEVGAKLQRDGLGLEVAAYHVDWDRVQLNSLTNGVPVLRNGGRAKIDGVELQAQWRPGAGFEFGAALGFNRARLTAIDAATAAATGARPGDALPNAPRRTLAAFGEYRFALGTVPASTGVTLKHSGPKPSGYSADPLNVPYTVPAFTTLDVRLGLDFGTTQLRLGIDNLTDRNGVTSYTTVQVVPGTVPTSTAWLTRPRTVGLQVEHLF